MSKHLFAVCFFLLSINTAVAVPLPADPAFPTVSAIERYSPSIQSPRVALVVGNSDYQGQPLRTPVKDARAVASLLENKGFEVIQLENATRAALLHALQELNARLGDTGTGLFYFAGHGLQTSDESVLILPVDADAASMDSVRRSALSLERILSQMTFQRRGQRNLVIIDSCLNNPYNLQDRDADVSGVFSPGLPEQSLVAFATARGAVAYDGTEKRGIYAQALLNALQQPGLNLHATFELVSHTVSTRTRNRQVPWIMSTLQLSPAIPASPTAHPLVLTPEQLSAMRVRGILPQDSDAQYELEFWQSIKNSTDASDYEAYLEAFPDGKFAPLAKARAKRYKKSTPPPAPQPALVIKELNADYKVVRDANIRETPSAKSRRLGKLNRGGWVHVTGQLANKKWYRVRSEGQTGYVFAELLTKPAPKKAAPKKPAPKPKPVAKPVKPPPAKPQPVKVEELQDCPSCPTLLALPAGSFTMGQKKGDRSERPAHRVSIRQPFAIGKHEVTVAQWNECAKAGACSYRPDLDNPEDDSPIRDISWSDTQEYVAWLSKVTGKTYRLPTEAEWEYAARGGTQTRFWWGNQVGSGQADCKNCGGKWNKNDPAAVYSFPANAFGLYGTSGGVWEWVADCWHKTHQGAPADGSARNKRDCRENVIRGGAWRNDASYVHSASRFKYDTHVRYLLNGFRVARTLP